MKEERGWRKEGREGVGAAGVMSFGLGAGLGALLV